MLVDSIVMIHVELHLRVDLAEIGHEAAEDAGLVHPAQDRFGIVATGQQVQEQRVGAFVLADTMVDQLRVARGLAHGFRVDFQLFGLGQLEHLDQAHGVLAEIVVRGRGNAPAEYAVALQFARLLAEGGEETAARGAGGEIVLDMGEEDTGQATDMLHLQEIELHEALDGRLAWTIGEVHPL